MTCIKTSGICHPPGYPFYILTAKLFSLLPWGSLAFKVNLFSALCACLALGIFGLAVLTVFPLPAGLTALLDLIERLETAHPDAAALTTARLIAQAALDRRESRGGHRRRDWPETSSMAAHTHVSLSGRKRAAA